MFPPPARHTSFSTSEDQFETWKDPLGTSPDIKLNIDVKSTQHKTTKGRNINSRSLSNLLS